MTSSYMDYADSCQASCSISQKHQLPQQARQPRRMFCGMEVHSRLLSGLADGIAVLRFVALLSGLLAAGLGVQEGCISAGQLESTDSMGCRPA